MWWTSIDHASCLLPFCDAPAGMSLTPDTLGMVKW